jgi:hypothetical protein
MNGPTMSESEITDLATKICEAGWSEEFSFQNRFNRDLVAIAIKQRGGKVRRWMIGNQLIDPRYTVEGRHLPDKGLANDSIMTNLYNLERVL